MKPRSILVLGLVLLVAGCGATLYLGLMIAGARVGAIFGSLVTEAPSNSFPRIRCPPLLTTGERAVVGVTLANRTDKSLSYGVSIQAAGLHLDAPTTFQGVTLGAGLLLCLPFALNRRGSAPAERDNTTRETK